MKEKSCDTCACKRMESVDEEGNRIVDCAANVRQMFAPFAEECKHWRAKLEKEGE